MAGTLYVSGGDVLINSLAGNGVAPGSPIGAAVFPSDADYTPAAAVYQNHIIQVIGTLSAQRKLILPLVAGWHFVANQTTGSQAINVIGATGTGIVIANARGAFVWCDGTNFYRATADTVLSS